MCQKKLCLNVSDLLLQLLQMYILLVFLMALSNLEQLIYQKIMYLMIVGLFKIYIDIKNRICKHYDDSVKSEKIESQNFLINKKTLKIW